MQIISESGEMTFDWYWWDLIFVISIIIIKKLPNYMYYRWQGKKKEGEEAGLISIDLTF